ncbi:MAG: serpin family protein, partial [Bacteroidota bacterium]
NLMLSPLSASVALTMLLNGADGETAAQIQQALGYPAGWDLAQINADYQSLREQLLRADEEVQLALANAAFYRESFDATSPFKPPFLDVLRTGYDARVEGLDFSAASALDTINGWASENTNGRIPTVLEEIDPTLVLVLMNALYFKGSWSTPFDEDDTAPAPFTRADGSTVQAQTMAATVLVWSASGDGYQAVELPYGRKNFSMVVLLPADPATPLSAFAAQLDAGLWDDATTRLGAVPDPGDLRVRLPRFSFSYDQALNSHLQALGIRDAFVEGRADLSRMNDAPLFLSFVKQNTFVEVNEEGTEAAAVTTGGIGVTSVPPSFAADRPFVFAIRERTTNTLLFIGQVTDPTAES